MAQAPDPLPLPVAERIDALCDRFEVRWKAGPRPRLEAFLQNAAASERRELFRALLRVELELCLGQKESPTADAYRRRFPDLADVVAAVFAEARRAGETSVSSSSVVTSPPPPAAPTASDVPDRIGRFEVRAVLGQGAFGRVYRAFDPQLGRDVAIKMPLPGSLADTDRERFLREARAVAALRHPNVCPIYEVSQADGRDFLVMALIPGPSLAALLKDRKTPLPTRQAAQIVRRLALALGAAHAKGIIHRDLKPANVLLDQERRDVVVMDFGLARHRHGDLTAAVQTQEGQLLGTPAYVAPEQAAGQMAAIGPATDVHALGVILYELLTGRRPFTGTVWEILGKVQHVAPEPPGWHRPGLDPRLDAVCLRCLAKAPEERFPSMQALAEALAPLTRADPPAPLPAAAATVPLVGPEVSATAAPRLEDVFAALSAERTATADAVARAVAKGRTPLWHWLVAGGFAAALVVCGIIFFARTPTALVQITIDVNLDDPGLAFFLDGANVAADRLRQPVELTVGDHELLVMRGEQVFRKFTFTVRKDRPEIAIVDRSPRPPPLPAATVPAPRPGAGPKCPLDHLDPAAIPAAERRLWHPPELVAVLGNSGMRLVALALAFSPDHTLVAAGGEQERSVKVWEVASGKEIRHLGDFPGWVTGVAWSPDGKRLYAGSGDEIRVIDFATSKTLHTWRGQRGGLADLALSPDGTRLVAAGGGQHGQPLGKDLELWDTTTGEKLRTAQGCFSSVAFSPDGKALAVGTWAAGGHGGAALWDAATLTERHRLPEVAEAYWVAFSGNGQYVAVAGSTDTKARIDEAATGKLLRTFPCGQTNVVRVALQANGQVLVTGCDNGKVTLWETATGQEIRALRGAEGLLAMTPDGHLLATCSGDGTVRLWDAATGNELFPRTGPQEMGAMAVSPDGATLATGGATRRLWDARTAKVRQALILHRGSVGGVVFSPDGRTLASSGGGTVRLWDAATGDERRSFADLTGGLGQVAFSRDGRLLAVVRKDGPANATVWDLATGQLRSTLQGRDDPGTRGFLRQVAFNSTAALLATCSGPEIRLWDTATGRQVAELTVPNNEVNDLAFSPDGRRLAACYFEDLLKVWDVATRNEIRTLRGHGENLSGVAWSPDGKQLASAGADGTVRLWDGETGAAGKVFRLHRPSGHLGGLTFSPEGRHLLVNSGQGTVFVLRLGLPAPAP